MNNRPKSKFRVVVVLLVLLVIVAITYWYKFRRDVAQPAWITATARDNFLYGSTGAERDAGIPYWIWLVLPRIFPEYMHYPGGYVALGMTWEEGKEMPAGFSKRRSATSAWPRTAHSAMPVLIVQLRMQRRKWLLPFPATRSISSRCSRS